MGVEVLPRLWGGPRDGGQLSEVDEVEPGSPDCIMYWPLEEEQALGLTSKKHQFDFAWESSWLIPHLGSFAWFEGVAARFRFYFLSFSFDFSMSLPGMALNLPAFRPHRGLFHHPPERPGILLVPPLGLTLFVSALCWIYLRELKALPLSLCSYPSDVLLASAVCFARQHLESRGVNQPFRSVQKMCAI